MSKVPRRPRAPTEEFAAEQTTAADSGGAMAAQGGGPGHGIASHAAAVETLDWILKRWVLRPGPETAGDDAEAGLSKLESVRREIGFIDVKASAVLTHVSVMVATAGILMNYVAQSTIERSVMVSELALYLLIAVLCIRCIMHPPNWQADLSHPQALKEMEEEVRYLRRLVYFCSAFTVTVTMLLMITVPVLAYI